jgi:hypothetical protein
MMSPSDKEGNKFWELPHHIDEQLAQVPLPEAVLPCVCEAIERQTDPINLAA